MDALKNMRSWDDLVDTSGGWREWDPPSSQGRVSVQERTYEGRYENPPQSPLELEQRFTEMEAKIQQLGKEIKRLRQHGSPIVPSPQVPVTLVQEFQVKQLWVVPIWDHCMGNIGCKNLQSFWDVKI
uniref:Uncharacterized protein n=1 Tax=Cannabis sativa TaxID=3483 RepID=A0A803PTX5_CANSA